MVTISLVYPPNHFLPSNSKNFFLNWLTIHVNEYILFSVIFAGGKMRKINLINFVTANEAWECINSQLRAVEKNHDYELPFLTKREDFDSRWLSKIEKYVEAEVLSEVKDNYPILMVGGNFISLDSNDEKELSPKPTLLGITAVINTYAKKTQKQYYDLISKKIDGVQSNRLNECCDFLLNWHSNKYNDINSQSTPIWEINNIVLQKKQYIKSSYPKEISKYQEKFKTKNPEKTLKNIDLIRIILTRKILKYALLGINILIIFYILRRYYRKIPSEYRYKDYLCHRP